MTPTGLLHPTDDMEASVRYFRDVLGLKQKFRDGDRYCAFELGGMALGLVAGEEKIVDAPTLVFRADDIDAAINTMTGNGAKIVRPKERGPHEDRVILSVPGGGAVVVSAKIK